MGTSGMDIEKAVTHLNTNAHAKSQSRCARYVRQAIVAGGVRFTTWPVFACNYGPTLTNAGFESVAAEGYVPVKGDVIVIQAYPGGNPAGHIEMYNGSQWVSDFKQAGHDIWPGGTYRKFTPAYAIFRP